MYIFNITFTTLLLHNGSWRVNEVMANTIVFKYAI